MLSISSLKILLTFLLCGLLTLAAQVAGHDAPIRSVRYSTSSSGSSFLVTGGWDKTLKYWDLRTRSSLLLGVCLSDGSAKADCQRVLLCGRRRGDGGRGPTAGTLLHDGRERGRARRRNGRAQDPTVRQSVHLLASRPPRRPPSREGQRAP